MDNRNYRLAASDPRGGYRRRSPVRKACACVPLRETVQRVSQRDYDRAMTTIINYLSQRRADDQFEELYNRGNTADEQYVDESYDTDNTLNETYSRRNSYDNSPYNLYSPEEATFGGTTSGTYSGEGY